MSAKLAIICAPNKFSAKLQAFGEKLVGRRPHPAFPYHCAWLTDEAIYDMNWRFRKVPRDHYAGHDVRVFESPVPIGDDYLEFMVGRRAYGTVDVALYPILTPLGLNWAGTHCAEAINDDLWFHGFRTPFIPYGPPPTPADVLWWAEGNLEQLF